MTVVTDASPLIALRRIRRDDLLPRLFERVVAPPAVAQEMGDPPAWIEIVAPPAADAAALRTRLDAGEAEAIALAVSLGATLLVDERKGRLVAGELGLRVRGTIGVLLLAASEGHLGAVRPVLDDLIAAGFHVGPRLYVDALRLAGEAPG